MAYDKRYNGWTNYETWNVALWIDNDQGSYSMRCEWAQESWDESDKDENDAVCSLADKLRDFVEENNPVAGDSSMYSDLMSTALSEVNWYEIAENWLEDVDRSEDDNEDDDESETESKDKSVEAE